MLYAIVAVLVLILDQGLKYYVTLNIPLNTGSVTLIPKVLSLMNIHNTGAAFGMLGGGAMRWGFVVLAVGFTGVVVWALMTGRVKSRTIRWLLVLIAAGGIGNAIDRALFGYVVDMFHFDLSFLSWFAIFNVADIAITVPGILLCIAIFFSSDGEKRAEKQEKTEKPKVVLRSRKKEPDPELKARRDAGKLYDASDTRSATASSASSMTTPPPTTRPIPSASSSTRPPNRSGRSRSPGRNRRPHRSSRNPPRPKPICPWSSSSAA